MHKHLYKLFIKVPEVSSSLLALMRIPLPDFRKILRNSLVGGTFGAIISKNWDDITSSSSQKSYCVVQIKSISAVNNHHPVLDSFH